MFGILYLGDMMALIDIKGIGINKLSSFNNHNIYDENDLINFFPFRYENIKRSDESNLNDGDKIIIDGIIESVPSLFYFNRKMNKMSFRLNSGNNLYNVSIYNRGFLKPKLGINSKVTIIGKFDKKKTSIIASDIRFGLLDVNEGIFPIYHSISGINSNEIHKYINEVIGKIDVIDFLPSYLCDKYNFISKNDAVNNVHNPSDINLLKSSINRLKYEELFIFMTKMNYLRNNKTSMNGLKRDVSYDDVLSFIKSLPFSLTSDQLNAVNDIYNDLISEKRMNRLVQGDVGSGKTIVSFISMYINYLSGYQSALMVPTEILAIQHYENIKKIFSSYNINVSLLTGKTKNKEKKKIYED